jgi:hypothetical protein
VIGGLSMFYVTLDLDVRVIAVACNLACVEIGDIGGALQELVRTPTLLTSHRSICRSRPCKCGKRLSNKAFWYTSADPWASALCRRGWVFRFGSLRLELRASARVAQS